MSDSLTYTCEKCGNGIKEMNMTKDQTTGMRTFAETAGERHHEAMTRYRETYRIARTMRRDGRSTLQEVRNTEDDLDVARHEFVLVEADLTRANYEMLRRLVRQDAAKPLDANAVPK